MKRIAFTIVGARFHAGGVEAVKKLQRGEVITLQRERNNKFDPHAIKCICAGKFSGYVPREVASGLCGALDGGKFAIICRRSAFSAVGHCEVTVNNPPFCWLCEGEGRTGIRPEDTCPDCDGTGH